MADLFKIPADIMPSLLEAHASGKKDFDGVIAGVVMLYKVTAIQARAAFKADLAGAQRDASLESLRKEAVGYAIPPKLLKLVIAGEKHIADHSIVEVKKGDKVITESFTPKLTYIVTVEEGKAKLEILSGKVGKRSKDGAVGSNSRISAFVAWERGAKKGDKFKVVKADSDGKKGYKVDGRFVPSRGKGGLAAFILKVHAKSHTAKILTDYGYSL